MGETEEEGEIQVRRTVKCYDRVMSMSKVFVFLCLEETVHVYLYFYLHREKK